MKFGDLSKPAKDLINDDYASGISMKAKTKAGGVGVTIEASRDDMGSITSKIGTKFAYAGLNFDKLQFKPDGSNVLETSMVPCPGCKMTFKANKGADLGFEYVKSGVTTTGTLDVLGMSKLSASTCAGVAPGINAGADLVYNLSGNKAGLSSYNVGVQYASGPLTASVVSASKLSTFNVGVLYKVNGDLSLATSSSHSGSNLAAFNAVGAAYTGMPQVGTIKAKYDSKGTISASVITDVAPKVSLTASLAVSGENGFSHGIGITM
jgi:voltage-dependent anion channel protein 2